MKIIEIRADRLQIELNCAELRAIEQALADVFDRIHASEFPSRLGVSRDDVLALSQSLERMVRDLPAAG